MPVSAGPKAIVERLRDAVNAHDLEALMDCYAPDIRGEEPTLQDRNFRGNDQLRANWATIFEGLPDLRMELLDCVEQGDTVWAEWRWYASRPDGSPVGRAGVIIYDVRDGHVVRLRRYMGPLQDRRLSMVS